MAWRDLLLPMKSRRPQRCVVTFNNEGITCSGPSVVQAVRWSELRAVVIKTTDCGPLADDLFWAFLGETSRCVVPSESDGIDALEARVRQLPGFDRQAFAKAIRCTENRRFICWKRRSGADPGAPAVGAEIETG